MLTKAELIREVATKLGTKKTQVEEVLDTLCTVVGAHLSETKSKNGESKKRSSIRFGNFGTLYCSYVKGHKGFNPQNRDEKIDIPDSFRISLSASAKFKEIVNMSKKKKTVEKVTKKEAPVSKKSKKVEEKKVTKKAAKPVKKSKKPVDDDDED